MTRPRQKVTQLHIGGLQIGIDARMTHYRTGGISTTIRRLIAAYEHLDTDGHHFTIFHSRKMRDTLSEKFSRANLWTPPHNRLERYALPIELIRHRLDGHPLDVWHAVDFIPPPFGAKRMIASVHDLNFLYYPQFLTPESRRYYNDQIEWAVRRADHILTISEASKRDLIKLLNVPADKISVHLLAAEPSFRPLPRATTDHVLRDLNLSDGYFLFVGTFEPRKNITGLLDAYVILRKTVQNVPPLVLAGNRGWLYEDTLSRIDQLHLRESVLIRESVSQDALPSLYNRACALILPSHYEGFGLPALEAMACGTVPIVSNRSSLPEVVGEVGLQVDPDDPAALAEAMRRVLDDDAWRTAQQQAGLARASTFTWERAARIALSVYTT